MPLVCNGKFKKLFENYLNKKFIFYYQDANGEWDGCHETANFLATLKRAYLIIQTNSVVDK